jgi:hypothetical protein
MEYCYTYGAFALRILKRLITQGKIKAVITTPQIKQHLRAAFAGGRNEYISSPKENKNLISIDYNLMYYNCLKQKYLCGFLYKTKVEDCSLPGFYDITYESAGLTFPVLFVKNKLTEQNYFF